MKEISIMGIDIAKTVFQLHAVNKKGEMIFAKRLSRAKLLPFIKTLPACKIGMEACSEASYWARQFRRIGHEVKLIPPQFVTPYVKTNKNDYRDAEAIAEAMSRPHMRFAATKEVWQQDIQCLHRVRQRLVRQRTRLSNQIRGLLREYGQAIPQGVAKVKKQVPLILEDATNELTDSMRELFDDLLCELLGLEAKIKKYDLKIIQIAQNNEVCQRLQKVEGIGPITSTALVSAIADAGVFKNGRQLAAWLGLVPRQHSSGGKNVLLRISKRGNRYLRTLLVHGARSVLKGAATRKDRWAQWIMKKKESIGFNKTCVAIAHRNARVVWALMKYGTEYQSKEA